MTMPGFSRLIDISLRIVDPLDDHRLFDMHGDAAEMAARIDALMPSPGAGRCLLSAPAYYLLANGVIDMEAVNRFLLAQRRRCAQVIGVFGVVEPKYGDAAYEALERLARSGARGVIWSPRAQGIFGDAPLLADLVRKAHGVGLLSMVRAAPYSTNEALWRIWRLAEQCQEIPIIVSGALQNFDSAQMIAQSAGRHDNLYYDTAGWTASSFVPHLVNIIGARLLFGTAGLEPSVAGAERLASDLKHAGIGDRAISDLLSGNASRLLSLNEGEVGA